MNRNDDGFLTFPYPVFKIVSFIEVRITFVPLCTGSEKRNYFVALPLFRARLQNSKFTIIFDKLLAKRYHIIMLAPF